MRGAFLASDARTSSSTGFADITFSHFGHSELATWIETGPPWLSPWRTPPIIETTSASKF